MESNPSSGVAPVNSASRLTSKFITVSALMPNPSLNRTRYGKRRKPGLRHLVHHLSSGLRRLPPRSG
jgi:hypothetical protein